MFSPFRSASKQSSARKPAEQPTVDDDNGVDFIEDYESPFKQRPKGLWSSWFGSKELFDFEIPADANPPEVPEFAGDGWKTMIENGEADAYIAGIVAKYMPVDGSSPSMSASTKTGGGRGGKRTRAADTPDTNANKKSKATPKRKSPVRKTEDDDNNDVVVETTKAARGDDNDNDNDDKQEDGDNAANERFDDRREMLRICGDDALANVLAENGVARLTQLETLTAEYIAQLLRDAGFNLEADGGVGAAWPQMAEARLADEPWETVEGMRPHVQRKAGRSRKRTSIATAGESSKTSSPAAAVESRRPQRKATATPKARAIASATPKSRRKPVK